jgi:hypothetical protein
MPTPDQMLSQRLMIISRRLQTEDHLFEPLLDLHRFRLRKKFPESLYVILKDQSLEKGFPCGRTKKGMVLVFSHINADE